MKKKYYLYFLGSCFCFITIWAFITPVEAFANSSSVIVHTESHIHTHTEVSGNNDGKSRAQGFVDIRTNVDGKKKHVHHILEGGSVNNSVNSHAVMSNATVTTMKKGTDGRVEKTGARVATLKVPKPVHQSRDSVNKKDRELLKHLVSAWDAGDDNQTQEEGRLIINTIIFYALFTFSF